jgi:hypothetical protein
MRDLLDALGWNSSYEPSRIMARVIVGYAVVALVGTVLMVILGLAGVYGRP